MRGIDVAVAFLLPVLGLLLAVVLLCDAESKDRGLLVVVVSLIAMVVWRIICSWTGVLSGF